jgi:hypothetical protein
VTMRTFWWPWRYTYNVKKATCVMRCRTCHGAVSYWVHSVPFAVAVSSQRQLNSSVQYDSGSQSDLTATSSWSSTATSIASVSNGLVSGLSPGDVNIAATSPTQIIAGTDCEAYTPPPCPRTPLQSSGTGNVQKCPTSMSVDAVTPKSLPDYDNPSWLTGVGILTRMKVAGPAGDYKDTVLVETVTPTSNSCPSSIAQTTSFPTYTAADNKEFVVGASAHWEGTDFQSMLNDFYDSHKLLVNIDVLGSTAVQSCVAKATQTYLCSGSTVGTFTLTNTYNKGTLNGNSVTNVTTTKQ